MTLRLAPRWRRPLLVAAVLAVFAGALAAWASGPDLRSQGLSGAAQRALAAREARLAPVAPAGGDLSGSAATGGKSPARSVRMTVESDAPIVKLSYKVRGGKPAKYSATMARAPVVVVTTARGYGLVAEIAAQASPNATYITCTMTVDGHLSSRHTVKGPWGVTDCLG